MRRKTSNNTLYAICSDGILPNHNIYIRRRKYYKLNILCLCELCTPPCNAAPGANMIHSAAILYLTPGSHA